ncbi:hypothetical protein L593_08455 [Salinarchaeum sp. Harcht-Bsk1]|uniref:hypothetical protein n=1 Tax=Salinarchaeum sp. Harcht-Bsk1 TaxID=1333523 RepID=UPI0003422E1A|nr:hypothetical protein [Salinarchaeum sp. Harcht-Bsk1]AGN01636.1 hypothetical protein L593_08455 [Salinarchaeum sp. Harcht-Bsk1]
MQRRRFLSAATAATTAAMAGCSGLLGGDGGGKSAPEQTVEDLYAAIDAGNAEEARSYIHPDGPLAENPAVAGFGDAHIAIESTTLVEKTDSRATVEYVLVVNDEELTNEHELRKHEGEWLVWD